METTSPQDYQPYTRLLLDMASERSTGALLRLIANRLSTCCHVALARIWLMGPGDVCDVCRMRPECLDQSRCLHLAASAGMSLDGFTTWSRLNGELRRFPLGVRKVGMIAQRAAPMEVVEIQGDEPWIGSPEWVRHEQIRAFAGQPVIYNGKVLGVLAVFFRAPLSPDVSTWLRMIADHAAVAITNATAFEEIERLRTQLILENEYLREEIRAVQSYGDIIGVSDLLVKTMQQVELVAATDTTVLIQGESGTGKELIARAIHGQSDRSRNPMIKVNCASVPRELFESEFFGHAKGSFTGAVRDRIGRFELANEGTLFLDEVGEIPLDMQSKLLRVLQERTFERVGEEVTRQTNIRLIAATNRDLKTEVATGRFREDLYYRLSVFPIDMAPLRERRDDIPLLASRFIDQCCQRLGVSTRQLTQRHIAQLQSYNWPGNIRELQNVVERGVISSRTGKLEFQLPDPSPRDQSLPAPRTQSDQKTTALLTYADLKQIEKDNLLAALRRTNWRISGRDGVAELLGVNPTTLTSRMKSMGIQRPV